MSHTQPPATTPRGGRRRTAARRRRVNLTLVLAVLLPLLTGAALLLVRPETSAAPTYPPTRTTLTASTLICPSALPGSPEVALTSVADDVAGPVRVGLGKDTAEAQVASRRVTSVDDRGALAVSGADATAPGLVAGRAGGDEPAVAGCQPPSAVQWFTGVGAGASHQARLELTNPDSGTAVADVTVYGRDGVVDAPRLHGISVPGGSSVQLELGEVIPRTDDLALEVAVTRGRIGATVLDRYDRIGSQPATEDWMAGQAAPTKESTLLGLAPGSGRRTLTIANPGSDEVRASLKVIGTESVFAPDGAPEIRVPAQSVVRVPVSAVVNQAVAQDAIGVSVSATGPVTMSLRSIVRTDLSLAVVGASFDEESTVLLPEEPAKGARAADRQVVLGAATGAGTVTVTARAADGSTLKETSTEIVPDRGVVVRVPPGTRQLSVLPARTTVTGAVLTSADAGASVLPLTVPVRNGLVPQVRPGLP